MPKVSEEYKQSRREHILASARCCFARNGFQATSMQDLFTEIGLSSGAVYSYFGSKDEMIMAIAKENVRDVIDTIVSVADDEHSGSIGCALAAAIEMTAARDDEGAAGLTLQVWSEAVRNPALAAELRTQLGDARSEVSQVLARHQAAGRLPCTVPIDAITSVVLAVLPGLIVQRALLGADSVLGVEDALRALWPAG